MDSLLTGLKAHLKAQGKDVTPEVEMYLQQQASTQGQTIKQASQKLETAQKEANRLKNELNRAKEGWSKFLELLSKEFDQHKEKHSQLMDTLTTALAQAESEMQAAKAALQEAAASPVEPPEHPPVGAAEKNGDQHGAMQVEIAPKRGRDGEQNSIEDQLAKKLRSPAKTEVITVEGDF